MIKNIFKFDKRDWELILMLFKDMIMGVLTFNEQKIRVSYFLLKIHMYYQSKIEKETSAND